VWRLARLLGEILEHEKHSCHSRNQPKRAYYLTISYIRRRTLNYRTTPDSTRVHTDTFEHVNLKLRYP